VTRDAVDIVAPARALVDIDSTTGAKATPAWLAGYLRDRGYSVTEQPVDDSRSTSSPFQSLSRKSKSEVVFSALRLRAAVLSEPRRGRSSLRPRLVRCEGILAAQVAAADRLQREGESSCCCSSSARSAAATARAANDAAAARDI
jgi:hypothetical protein